MISQVLVLVMSTIAGTFLWDRLCVFVFAPAVFKASMEEHQKVSLKVTNCSHIRMTPPS